MSTGVKQHDLGVLAFLSLLKLIGMENMMGFFLVDSSADKGAEAGSASKSEVRAPAHSR